MLLIKEEEAKDVLEAEVVHFGHVEVKEEEKVEAKEKVNKIHPRKVEIGVLQEVVVKGEATTIRKSIIKVMSSVLHVEGSITIHGSVKLNMAWRRQILPSMRMKKGMASCFPKRKALLKRMSYGISKMEQLTT